MEKINRQIYGTFLVRNTILIGTNRKFGMHPQCHLGLIVLPDEDISLQLERGRNLAVSEVWAAIGHWSLVRCRCERVVCSSVLVQDKCVNRSASVEETTLILVAQLQ